MKKILTILLCGMLLFPTTAYAVEKPVNTVKNTAEDLAYLELLAESFSDRYIVEKTEAADISSVHEFYEKVSAPITVEELDIGKLNLDLNLIEGEDLKRYFSLFKLLGGIGEYFMTFRPLVCYQIHRDIVLVGGYSSCARNCETAIAAYPKCIGKIQDMTREVVGYDTRLQILEKVEWLHSAIEEDNRLKIFILKNGEINSVWEYNKSQDGRESF